jgi:Spy/CpxP family protein refolding chaperone
MKQLAIMLSSAVLAMSFAMPAAACPDSDMHDKKMMKHGIVSEKTVQSLNLDDKQKQAWQQAKNQLQQLRDQAKQVGKEEWQKVRKVVDEEAAKANPDLAKVQKAKMAMRDKMMQFRNQRQRIEMDFYNKLNAEQKKKVFANMQKRMDKFAQYHEKNKKMMKQ